MYQITKSVHNLIGVQDTNNVVYSSQNLEFFAETACIEIGLNNIREFLKQNDYDHWMLQRLIHSISRCKAIYGFVDITDTASKFHEELFDVMYQKELKELPLMINGDPVLMPVVRWRFNIGK